MTARRPRPRPGIPLLTGLLTGLLVPSALAAPASAATPQAAATPAPVTTSAPVITPQTLGRLPETGQAPSASPDLLPPLSLESVDPAVVWPGDKFTVSVIVTNQTDATLVDPVVEVWVGWRPVGSRSALADWVYGPIAPDMTPHAVEGLEPLAPGESAPASVTLAIDTLALGEGPRGPREMAVTVFDRGGERPDEPLAQVRTFMIWDPASGATDGTPADNVQVSLIAPLTGPPVRWEPGGADHGSGLTLQEQRPTAEYLEQLASLTRSGNSLGQLLEVAQATGTLHYGPDALALAVDPAVIAAALHSPDPELQAWAEALLETAAPKYRLPAYDPDLAALSRAGLSEYGLSDIVFSPIVPAWEPPEGWGPVLGWPGGAPVPDLETLGTARAASITTAVVEAGLEAHLGTVTGRAEVEVQEGYISALIADATLSELLHRATEVTGPTPLAMSRAEIVQRVLAETAMVSADNFGRDTHLLVVFPRNWNPAVEYLLAPLRALDDAPWVRLAPLDELLATDPPAVSRRPLPFSSSQEGELEVAVVQQLDAARSELDIISTVAEDPSPLRRVLTPGLTSVLSVAWRYQPAERAAAVD
ncbi:MAG: DUF6049 family protein, partial [Promicromonosporaceae bacterium]|nr:DUF6049 family protein [Promicromonosporaceae bacterium]